MSIQNIQQLKHYVHSLPWYKRIFFPRVIWTRLNEPKVVETDIRAIYHSVILTSWFGFFYTWLFPEVALFAQQPAELPANYESALICEMLSFYTGKVELERLANFLSTHPFEEDVLARILATSIWIKYPYGTRLLLSKAAYTTEVVRKIFVSALKNQPAVDLSKGWRGWSIDAVYAFTTDRSLREKLNAASINEAMLLTACCYQQLASSQEDRKLMEINRIEHNLKELLCGEHTRHTITLATIDQVLQHVIVPLQYESTDVKWVRDAIQFEDNEGHNLSTERLRALYLHTIKAGRVNVLAAFPEPMAQPDDELVIQSLKESAKFGHYAMILHFILSIPEQRRFDILQTKSVIQNNTTLKDRKKPNCTHILQWAACRSVDEDMQKILDALVNLEERYTLITRTPHDDDYSPLLLAAVNCRRDNLDRMLSAMSSEQIMKAVLPRKVTCLTPLDSFYSHSRETHEAMVMPILLSKLFGENQKLYDAYKYLKANLGWNSLCALRNHYLATYFPTPAQSTLRFFGLGFSIPRHRLSPDELNLVVRVVFYQNYHKFNCAQRSRIETQMNAYDQSLENVAANALT